MGTVVFDRRMSDVEGLMWRLERDARRASTFANLTILDRPPDLGRLRDRLALAAETAIPRLRQVVHELPGARANPSWIDDAEFDVDAHVRRIALPAPGGVRQLLDLAATITADPLDRARPLWQFTVFEGLPGGEAALLQKVHHAITDGEGGVLLARSFQDLERDPPEPPGSAAGVAPAAGDRTTEEPADAAAAVRDALAGALRFPLGVAREVRSLLAEPDRIAAASRAAAATVDDVAAQLGDRDGARSPLWRARSSRRRLEVASAPLGAVRAVARSLGGTVNTALLTIAAEAAGRYHDAEGAPVDRLRTSMPVSTRGTVSGTNAFGLVRLLVPTGSMDLADRFRAVDEAVRAARRDAARTSLDTMAAAAGTLPTAVLARLAEQQARTVDFATSNVRGSAAPLFVAGARVLRNHPIGPTLGVPFNLTLLSYEDRLDMGLHCDAAAIAEPAQLRNELAAAIERFCALAPR